MIKGETIRRWVCFSQISSWTYKIYKISSEERAAQKADELKQRIQSEAGIKNEENESHEIATDSRYALLNDEE